MPESAYFFDGVDDKITVPDSNGDFNVDNGLTISLWIKFPDELPNGSFVSKSSRSQNTGYIFPYITGNGDGFGLITHTSSCGWCDHRRSFSYQNISDPQSWHCYTGVFDGTEKRVYIDGKLVSTDLQEGNITANTNDLVIGTQPGYNEWANATVDDVRMYSRAISEAEVQLLSQQNTPNPDLNAGLVAYYPFNENANDASGNGNHGTVNGAVLSEDKFGNASHAFSFDGTDDYIEVPHSQSLNMPSFTLFSWVKFNSDIGKTQKRIVCKQQNNSHAYGLEIFGNGFYGSIGNRLVMHTSDGSTWYTVMSETQLNPGEWYNVVGTYDGTEMKLYINGVSDASLLQPNGQTLDNNAPLFIGRSQPGIIYAFDGSIDETRIYNRALSQEEIQKLYQLSNADSLIYSNDFETNAGNEWSNTSTDITPEGNRKFLGQFGSETVSLSLDNLPDHSNVTVSFDLLILKSWDGNHTGYGPDMWSLAVGNNNTLIKTTFSNVDNRKQAYPENYPGGDNPEQTGADEIDPLDTVIIMEILFII
ncbi:MAG: LamG domain-containing protein [Desulfobacteraceae bacterium]|nr:LamG domain-containing protein [Desulfobacteraceae bacterium]